MIQYNHLKIEPKWQKYWEKHKMSEVQEDDAVPPQDRRYILDMFPYPSGAGLHVGHPEGYTATDIYARYLRMKGYQVLHPMGWDAFGLPAENYAIKQAVHPKESTYKNIDNFRRQIKSLGFSYDWSREIATCDPEYYKWTQWLFLLLYKNGLAFRKKAPVNWCESCQTVLAREQVMEGKCERCGNQVIQKELKQWFFKITDYAERLLSDLNKIDWPEPIKLMQRNWIGRSCGINIDYKVESVNKKITVFTTRPDTNFGATFITLAPDSQFVQENIDLFPNKEEAARYVKETAKKIELERIAEGRKKTGVFTGLYAINNLTDKKMPVYVGDFVLASVGAGAVVGVPGHDKRDFEFAQAMDLEIIRVVVGPDGDTSPITKIEQVQEEEGTMINSGFLDGLDIHDATVKMMDYLEEKGRGKRVTLYKLRDWLISRQRYWGAPIPIIYCEKCGELPVPEDQLPVELPNDVDFRPKGESPLERSKLFHKVKCPKCGSSKARRESDTMDTFVCSSWYHFRFTDPRNAHEFASKDKIKYWLPVSTYVGGAEHAVMHLLYARFFCKVLYDQGKVDFEEPFQKLINQGLILAQDGRKMSKSLDNVINPDDIVNEYGADTLRIYEMFMGPLEDAKPWDTKGIKGVRRFLEKVYKIIQNSKFNPASLQGQNYNSKFKIDDTVDVLLHKTIKKVGDDIEAFKFNTAISQLMILVNEMQKCDQLSIINYQLLITLLAPFAPHLAEELWSYFGNKESIFRQKWPEYDVNLIKNDLNTIVVQINGKVRDQFNISVDASSEEVLKQARASRKIQKWLDGQQVKKEIYVPNRIVNFVV
ncbi:MAG: leucine--tRNA ligase [Candidatus Jacksonbacteria bacterium]